MGSINIDKKIKIGFNFYAGNNELANELANDLIKIIKSWIQTQELFPLKGDIIVYNNTKYIIVERWISINKITFVFDIVN